MKWFDQLLGRTVSQPAPPDPEQFVEVEPDPRGAPGTRVYHEYFVDDEPVDGVYSWLVRVYAQDGAATEQRGTSSTKDGARNAALSWAAKTKAGLRGEA